LNALKTFSRPADPQIAADWEHVMRCGQAFVDAIERYCPAGKNRTEAFDRASKAVMVANGAFHTRRG
jgi:hypothetical protein